MGTRFPLCAQLRCPFQPRENSLLNPNPLESPALPNRLDLKRYRYARIGLTDETMGELIPPGSVVEIDIMQNVVKVSDWKTIRERPVYLVWHADGHSCCWCNQEGKELTLLPDRLRHPGRDASRCRKKLL